MRLKEERDGLLRQLRERYAAWLRSLTVAQLQREANAAYWADRAYVGELLRAYKEVTGRGFVPAAGTPRLPCLNAPLCPATVLAAGEYTSWTAFAGAEEARKRLKTRWDRFLGLEIPDEDDDEDDWDPTDRPPAKPFCCPACQPLLAAAADVVLATLRQRAPRPNQHAS